MSKAEVTAYWGTRCVRCGAPAHDIHEVFVKRRKGMMDVLRVPCNALPLCRSCHDWAQWEGRDWCKNLILRHFSVDEVTAFIKSVDKKGVLEVPHE